jgi:hypothetical protein
VSTLPALRLVGPPAPEERPRLAAPRVVSPAPRQAWAELLAGDPHALVTQTPAWTDCLCSLTGARDASRLYDFGGGRTLLLPLVRVRRTPRRYASFPNAWGFGGLVGAGPTPGEIRAVFNDLRAISGFGVRIRTNPLQHAAWDAGRPSGVTALPRRAHAIDLREGFEHVWKHDFSSRARNHVRKAERAGLRVELDSSGRLVPVFHDLFMRSVDRWASKQNEPRSLARFRAGRRDPLEKLHRMVADLDGAGRLWVAYVGDRAAAAILVLQGANAHYTRGAMDVELAGPRHANYLLHRLAIEDACRSGCATYQMGETGSSHSLAQFKQALGAEPYDYSEYVIERLPLTALDRNVRGVAKRALRFRDHD